MLTFLRLITHAALVSGREITYAALVSGRKITWGSHTVQDNVLLQCAPPFLMQSLEGAHMRTINNSLHYTYHVVPTFIEDTYLLVSLEVTHF